MPPSVPQEMLSSAQRAGVAQGPVPAPLAPPSQMPPPNTLKQQPAKVILTTQHAAYYYPTLLSRIL